MLHFLGQIFVIVWPAFLKLALFPLFIFSLYVDGLATDFLLPFGLFFHAFFAALGAVFLGSFILKPFKNVQSFFSRLLPRTKGALFGIVVGVLYLFTAAYTYLSLNAYLSILGGLGVFWFVLLLLEFAGLASTFWYLLKGAAHLGRNWTKTRPLFKKLLTLLGIVLLGYPFLVVAVILTWFLWDPMGAIADYQDHTLHAAVKNTCILDPNKDNCPQKLEDIRVIVPQVYDEVSSNSQLKYEYNPTDNTYVLVIRYGPTQAAMFSNRFERDTGWHADYKEMEVSVLGKDRIPDPLLEGDWIFPEWEYRYRAPYFFWYDY